MKKSRYLILILALTFLIGVIFHHQISTHLKIILFITEQFPQIPIKPLGLLTKQPSHQLIEFESDNGEVVADLYIPQPPQQPKPAIILAMGVRTQEKDKVLLWHFADSMARLGYVTFWPRLEFLDTGGISLEEPETFIRSFEYMASLPQTDSKRISFVGFSVGSSIALVAAEDPSIADQVYGLVSFGGYLDARDYLKSLTTNSHTLNGQTIPWDAAEGATGHLKDLMEAKGVAESEVEQYLEQFNPKINLADFKAKIFILHDKSDTYVPYSQSVELKETLPEEQIGAYVITDLFEHVQPNRPIDMGELFKLYGFLYKTLSLL